VTFHFGSAIIGALLAMAQQHRPEHASPIAARCWNDASISILEPSDCIAVTVANLL
jgi:hypothetical protein